MERKKSHSSFTRLFHPLSPRESSKEGIQMPSLPRSPGRKKYIPTAIKRKYEFLLRCSIALLLSITRSLTRLSLPVASVVDLTPSHSPGDPASIASPSHHTSGRGRERCGRKRRSIAATAGGCYMCQQPFWFQLIHTFLAPHSYTFVHTYTHPG